MRPEEAEALGWHDRFEMERENMCCLDPMHFPALPDDRASSYYWYETQRLREQFRVPGSRNADAPMRAACAAGKWPRIDPDNPEPGRYMVRLEPRGPFVPCLMFQTIGCKVNGIYVNPDDWWWQACKYAISIPQFEELEAWCHEF